MSNLPVDLRGDRPANLAVLAGFGTGVMLTAAVISRIVEPGFIEQRSNPVYWLLMMPIVIWVLFAAEWKSWALWLLPIILAAAPLGSGLIAALAGSTTLWVLTAISVVLSLLGYRWRQMSGMRP